MTLSGECCGARNSSLPARHRCVAALRGPDAAAMWSLGSVIFANLFSDVNPLEGRELCQRAEVADCGATERELLEG